MKTRSREAGATIVEATLVIPLFLLLLLGIFQLGMILSAQITLKNASAVAVRAAVLSSATADDVKQAAATAIQPSLDPARLTTALTSTTVNGLPASQVTLTYQYQVVVNFLPGMGGNIALSATSIMR